MMKTGHDINTPTYVLIFLSICEIIIFFTF